MIVWLDLGKSEPWAAVNDGKEPYSKDYFVSLRDRAKPSCNERSANSNVDLNGESEYAAKTFSQLTVIDNKQWTFYPTWDFQR